MDHKREGRTPPTTRVMGVGRQQQVGGICCGGIAHKLYQDRLYTLYLYNTGLTYILYQEVLVHCIYMIPV